MSFVIQRGYTMFFVNKMLKFVKTAGNELFMNSFWNFIKVCEVKYSVIWDFSKCF